MTATDAELLKRYVRDRSESAFAELVQRHLDLVYSSALRQLDGDEALAKDVAQSVFVDLARKANSLADRTSMAGWLYTSARFAATSRVRSEQRRRLREQEAAQMHENPSAPTTEISWNQLRPLLDEVMHQLEDADREALLLRFFQGRDLKAVGAALGISDDAARKRVERALDKLRNGLVRRGISSTGAALGAALGSASIVIAPKGLSASITGAVFSTSLATTTTTGLLTMTKLKIGIAASLLVAGLGTTVLTQQHRNKQLRRENEELKAQATEAETLRAENTDLSKNQATPGDLERMQRERQELMRLRGKRTSGTGGALAVTVQFENRQPEAQTDEPTEEEMEEARQTVDTMKNLGLAARIFSTDNQDTFPTTFEEMKNIISPNLPVALEAFEFVQHIRPISEREPQMLLFRERTPRRLANGKWARVYAFADGSVQEQLADTEDFSTWENNHMVKKTPNE